MRSRFLTFSAGVLLACSSGEEPEVLPGPGPSPPGVLGLKADPGQWWIKGVDTFGVPIKAGASAAKIAVTLLNDQGETYTINGYGAGVAVGADFETEKLGKILGRLAELGLKSGDIANIHKKLSAFGPFSRTAGAVLRRGSLISNYTIHEIKKAGTMCVTSAAASKHYGIEIGLITFFPSAMITPIELAVMFGQIASGEPWGAYGNFSGGKISLEVGYMTYLITSVDKG